MGHMYVCVYVYIYMHTCVCIHLDMIDKGSGPCIGSLGSTRSVSGSV